MCDDAQAKGALEHNQRLGCVSRTLEVHFVEEGLEPWIILDRIEQMSGAQICEAWVADNKALFKNKD